jgi:uncharacterized protein (TIGR04255 family)
MGTQYINPPLVEALLEIRWKLQQKGDFTLIDPTYPMLPGVLYEKVKTTFPFIEVLPASDIPDSISPFTVKVRFRKEKDSWPLVQVGPGIGAINFVNEYTWDSFLEHSINFYVNLFDAYIKTANLGPPIIEKIQLRYINSFNLNNQETILSFLKNKLNTNIELPPSIGYQPDMGPVNLKLHVDCVLSNPKAIGTFRIGNKQNKGQKNLIGEIIIQSHSSDCDVLQTEEGFKTWIKQAHDIAELWFKALIKGDLEKSLGVKNDE